MNLRKGAFGRRHWLKFVYRRPLRLGNAGPVVSFTFDDFPRSAYTVGGAILKSHGARGTFYTAMGLMNSVDGAGEYFRLDDLYAAAADGHELATHTFHHISSHSCSADAFLLDVRLGREALQKVPGITGSDNFAFPHGAATASTKRMVGAELASCRGTVHGINGRVVDLNFLRANPLYGSSEQLDRVNCLLGENEKAGGWLIFYTHDVRETPSPYGCTPALFERTVALAAKRSMKILTIDEVLQAAHTQYRSTTASR